VTDDEILAALTAAIPDGNIYWTDEDQAQMLLPAVRELLNKPVDLLQLAGKIVSPSELRRRDGL
jgi:hypothetical protein